MTDRHLEASARALLEILDMSGRDDVRRCCVLRTAASLAGLPAGTASKDLAVEGDRLTALLTEVGIDPDLERLEAEVRGELVDILAEATPADSRAADEWVRDDDQWALRFVRAVEVVADRAMWETDEEARSAAAARLVDWCRSRIRDHTVAVQAWLDSGSGRLHPDNPYPEACGGDLEDRVRAVFGELEFDVEDFSVEELAEAFVHVRLHVAATRARREAGRVSPVDDDGEDVVGGQA